MSTAVDTTALVAEAKRVEEDALCSAKAHFEAAAFWHAAYYRLGVPIAVFSALAGASALAEFPYHEVIAGVISILVAILSSVNVFLNPQQKATQHHRAGADYQALRSSARIYHSIEVEADSAPESALKKLAGIRDDLNRKSPSIARRFFELARKGIEGGEASYAVDRSV